jgi:Tripartite tricarboxylate transporter TctB family
VAFGMGLLGIGMVRHGYPRSPLLVGFILFPLAEQSFFRSRQISRGSYDFLFRPITLTILVITLLALVSPLLWRMWVVRRARKAGTTPVAEATTTGEEDEEQAPRSGLQEAAVSGGLLAVAAGFAVAALAYTADARAFPLLVLVVLMALTAWGALRGLTRWRTERSTAEVEPRPRGDWASSIQSLAWIVAFPVLFWSLGAVIGVFVYVAAFMTYHRQVRPDVRSSVVALAAAAATAAFVYYTFQDYLGVTLPQGLFA